MAVPAGLLAQSQLDASGSRPFVLYFTHDDGPAAPAATLVGQPVSSTIKMVNLHLQAGTPATFFHLGCKFLSPTKQSPDPPTSWCASGWQDGSFAYSVDQVLAGAGFIIGNHTVDHIPLPSLEQNAAAVVKEIFANETLLDTVRLAGDVRLFREPGFRGDATVSAEIAADPRSKGLYWPVGAEIVDVNVCGNASPQITWYQGVDPIACAHQMSGQIAAQCTTTGGCIILVHEDDGSDFGDLELGQIFSDLGLDQPGSAFRADQMTGIPGILPPIHLGPLQTLTASFGEDDGVGQPLVGRPVASSVPSACKLRTGATLWCATPADPLNPALPLAAPAPWLTIHDAGFSGQWWLADVNGDGVDDLVYLTPQGFWAALSNGQNVFGTPSLWLPASAYSQLGAAQAVRFGRFCPKSSGLDLLLAFAGQAVVYSNYGGGFAAAFPRTVALPATADLQTLQPGDLNGDGLFDLVVRDPVNGQILASLDGPGGFAAFQPWMSFAGQTNLTGWNDPANGNTLFPVSFDGLTVLTAGTSTGIIFSPAVFDAAAGTGQFSNAWRHLCNQCFTDKLVPSWHPEWQASGLAWSGNAVVFTRASGLEVAFGTGGN